jgi:hypothetical protein
MSKIFISHATSDRVFVEKELIPLLLNYGIEPWYSADDILTSSHWEQELRDALDACDWFLLVMTPASLSSPWVNAEVHWAMDKRREKFIPLLKQDCSWENFHLMIRMIQLVDFRQSNYEAKKKLLAIWGIEAKATLGVIQTNTVVKLDKCIQDIRYSDQYDSFWMSSNTQALQIRCEPMQEVGVQSLTQLSETVNLTDLLVKRLEYEQINIQPVVNHTFGQGYGITYLLDDGNIIFSSIGNVRERRWEEFTFYKTGLPKHPVCGNDGPGLEVFATYEDGSLYVWKHGWQNVRQLQNSGSPIVAIDTSYSSIMVSAQNNSIVTIWSAETYERKISFSIGSDPATNLRINSAARIIATADTAGQIKIWNYAGKLIKSFIISGSVKALEFLSLNRDSTHHPYLAVASINHIEIWNFEECILAGSIESHAFEISTLTFNYAMSAKDRFFYSRNKLSSWESWLGVGYNNGIVSVQKIELP